MNEEMMQAPCGQHEDKTVRLTMGQMYIELKDPEKNSANRFSSADWTVPDPWFDKLDTVNASERFNRKIKKCFSGRYGIRSTESAKVLLRGLWLKELLLNGRQHLEATSQFKTIDCSAACQENLDTNKILHFSHDYDPSRIEKLA